jgi:hypothetical protein
MPRRGVVRTVGRGLCLAGGLSTVIGLDNILAAWHMDDLSHTASLLILNAVVLVLPGAALAAIGGALRNAGRRRGPLSLSHDRTPM